jgi:hypothetical protein
MTIDEETGEGVDVHFRVSFHERTMRELGKVDDTRDDEHQFATVSRLSDVACGVYDTVWRPLVQASITKETALALRNAHPGRTSRRLFSDANPLMGFARGQAEKAEKERKPAEASNPFLSLEKIWADGVIQTFDFWRDVRDASYELTFFSLFGSPAMQRLGASHDWKRPTLDIKALAHLPEVEAIMLGVGRGGFDVAVIRMLILMAQSRGNVRRDRLERSAEVLGQDEPFASLGADKRAAMIREQSIVVEFAPQQAIETLPTLLPERKDRERAIAVVGYIAGAIEEMEPDTIKMLQKLRDALELPDPAVATVQNPLQVAADFVTVDG